MQCLQLSLQLSNLCLELDAVCGSALPWWELTTPDAQEGLLAAVLELRALLDEQFIKCGDCGEMMTADDIAGHVCTHHSLAAPAAAAAVDGGRERFAAAALVVRLCRRRRAAAATPATAPRSSPRRPSFPLWRLRAGALPSLDGGGFVAARSPSSSARTSASRAPPEAAARDFQKGASALRKASDGSLLSDFGEQRGGLVGASPHSRLPT